MVIDETQSMARNQLSSTYTLALVVQTIVNYNIGRYINTFRTLYLYKRKN